MTTSTPHAIEKWYSGKALATIRSFVLPALAEAEAAGYWQPGVSRKVRAALNKPNVAIKFARANDRNYSTSTSAGLLHDVGVDRAARDIRYTTEGRRFVSAMRYGSFGEAPALVALGNTLEPYCVNDEERAALATARQWALDFAPVAELVARLDATRPVPTVVLGSLSPTVAANLGRSLGIAFETISVPTIEWSWVEMEIKGARVRVPVAKILWPEGTQHNRSRFAFGSRAGNHQCHACGHAIQRADNWIPLLARDAAGENPLSLWVGRDCAKRLFLVDVKGAAEYRRAPAQEQAA